MSGAATHLTWSDRALDDLAELRRHVRLDDPTAANPVARSIAAAVQSLIEFPRRGRPGRVDGTRELVLAPLPWLAVYGIEDDAIVILRVRHGAQDWPPRAGE